MMTFLAPAVMCALAVSASVKGPVDSITMSTFMANAQTGQPKPDITCPEDLAGKVGTTTRCTLKADDGSTLGVTVTVSSVDGHKINFDIKADDKASPAAN